MKLPKLCITDIDGVWTDGGMYYDKHGNELKKFNTSDSAGVLFLRLNKIPTAIITGEDSEIVRLRAAKLNIVDVFCGEKNKISAANRLCEKYQIQLSDVAFIGNDLNDLPLLQLVGWSGCPSDSPEYVKSKVLFCMNKKGGEGVYREFVEFILNEYQLLTPTIEKFLAAHNLPS